MGFASRRVLVLALCIGSVALAGLMFPVTGIGDVPSLGSGPGEPATTGSTPDTDGSGTPGGPGTPTPRSTDDVATDSTGTPGAATDGPTATLAGTGTPSVTGTQVSDATPAATPTPTPTATPTPGADGAAGDRDPTGLLALVSVSLWWLLAAAAIVVVPGVALEGKHRGWPVFRRLPIPAVSVVSLGQSVPQATTAILVDVSGSAARLASGLGTALAGTSRGLAVVTSGLARGIGGLALSLPGAFAGGLPSLSGLSLSGLSLWSGSTTTLGGDSGASTGSARRPDPPDPDDEDPSSTVEDAWVAMVERLPVGNWRTKTPMELAGAAVDSGLPADPVYALTEAFRDVAYGGVTPSEERTERALAALERVRQALEGEE